MGNCAGGRAGDAQVLPLMTVHDLVMGLINPEFLKGCIDEMLFVSNSAIAEQPYTITINPQLMHRETYMPYKKFVSRYKRLGMAEITVGNIKPEAEAGLLKLVFFATPQEQALLANGLNPTFQDPASNFYLTSTDPELLKQQMGHTSPQYRVYVIATIARPTPVPERPNMWRIPGKRFRWTLPIAFIDFTSTN